MAGIHQALFMASSAAAGKSYRFWKVDVMAQDGDDTYASLAEVAFRPTPGGAGATINTVSTTASDYPGYPVGNLIDGSTSSLWISAAPVLTMPYSLQFDLGVAISIATLAIYPYASALTRAPRDFTVWGSHDGSVFTLVTTVTNSTGWTNAWREFTL